MSEETPMTFADANPVLFRQMYEHLTGVATKLSAMIGPLQAGSALLATAVGIALTGMSKECVVEWMRQNADNLESDTPAPRPKPQLRIVN